jgi:hypothetical protein
MLTVDYAAESVPGTKKKAVLRHVNKHKCIY